MAKSCARWILALAMVRASNAVIDAGNYATWNPTVTASRRLEDGPIGEGARFEWTLKGFGKVIQEFHEFQPNRSVRIVPQLKTLGGGHRFLFTAQGDATRVEHELEMLPKGIFRLLGPMMARTGRRNLRDTAEALRTHLESG